MPTLLLADLHLSANPRDAYRINTLRRLVDRAHKLRISETYILGDLTEEKDRHSDYLTNKVVELVRLYAGLGPVTILQGNHDSDSDPECPFFHFLRHVPQVRWIGKPTVERAHGLGRVLWLPHARDWKTAWSNIPRVDIAYVFVHGMFAGAELGNNIQAAEGISRKALPHDAVVYAGDVHIPQDRNGFSYVGAPYTVDFGDTYDARAIVLDDMGRRDKDIALSGYPQKRLLTLDARSREPVDIGFNKGDILKIRVTLRRSRATLWPTERDRLRRIYSELGGVVHSIVPVIIEEPGQRVRLSGARLKSDKQILREFAQHRGLDKGTLKQGEKLL